MQKMIYLRQTYSSLYHFNSSFSLNLHLLYEHEPSLNWTWSDNVHTFISSFFSDTLY